MPRVCNTCSHPDLEEINSLLLRNTPYLTISRKFDVSRHSVGNHYKMHLRPVIKKANQQAEKQIVSKISSYQVEVNYAPLDKIKFFQGQLLNEFQSAVDSSAKVRIIREIRGWFQEEAKLCGLYTIDKENPEVLRHKALVLLSAVAELQEQSPESDPKRLLGQLAEVAASES